MPAFEFVFPPSYAHAHSHNALRFVRWSDTALESKGRKVHCQEGIMCVWRCRYCNHALLSGNWIKAIRRAAVDLFGQNFSKVTHDQLSKLGPVRVEWNAVRPVFYMGVPPTMRECIKHVQTDRLLTMTLAGRPPKPAEVVVVVFVADCECSSGQWLSVVSHTINRNPPEPKRFFSHRIGCEVVCIVVKSRSLSLGRSHNRFATQLSRR